MFHKRLTWACDIIIINACGLTALLTWSAGMDWAWGLSLLNCVAVIALRQWLMHSLEIPWMESWLNLGLKLMLGVLAAALFLVTAFPLIIVIQTILIKSSKLQSKALFAEAEVHVGEEKSFNALVFNNSLTQGGSWLSASPLAVYFLVGKLTLSDISMLSVTRQTNEKKDEPPAPQAKVQTKEEDTPPGHDYTINTDIT